MNIIKELLQGIPLPRMARVLQNFPVTEVGDLVGALRQEMHKPTILSSIKPWMRISIAVGSRGVAEIPTLARNQNRVTASVS